MTMIAATRSSSCEHVSHSEAAEGMNCLPSAFACTSDTARSGLSQERLLTWAMR